MPPAYATPWVTVPSIPELSSEWLANIYLVVVQLVDSVRMHSTQAIQAGLVVVGLMVLVMFPGILTIPAHAIIVIIRILWQIPVIVLTVIVRLLGFGVIGVTKGSLAAAYQATYLGETIVARSLFSLAQSLGATVGFYSVCRDFHHVDVL